MVYVTKISLKWVKRDLIALPIAKLLVSRRRLCEILTLGDLRSTVPCPVSNCCHTICEISLSLYYQHSEGNSIHYRKFSEASSCPNTTPLPPRSIIFVSDDGNLPVKYRPNTEVLELPALSFQTAHNRVEGAGEVTVSSTKCLECRSRESAPLRSGREAQTLSAGTVLAAKPEDWSTAPQHLLPMLER